MNQQPPVGKIIAQRLSIVTALMPEVLQELDEIEASQKRHRETCPCEASRITIDLIGEHRFAVKEYLSRSEKIQEKAVRAHATLNGDKSQSN